MEILTCKRIIYLMLFLCFILDAMLKSNIGMAIVKMVDRNSSSSNDSAYRYNWNEEEKNDILGSFYWGYMLSPVLGGRLSEIYGTRIVLGTSMLLTSLLNICIPYICNFGYYWVIVARVTSGLLLGTVWPSIHPMAARWAPDTESSIFLQQRISISLGLAINFLICGFLIDRFDWPSVFYVTGVLLLIWSILWFYLIYDSPGQHPRISREERDRLENEIGARNDNKQKIKWRVLLSSKPVWAIIISYFCAYQSIGFMHVQLPSYINDVLHLSIRNNGFLSSIPNLMRYLVSLISCKIADTLRKKKAFSTTSIRKFFNITGLCGAALFYLILSFWGYSATIFVIMLTFAFGCLGATSAGFFSNSNDLSVEFCGTIFGLATTFAGVSGYLSTKIVALFIKNKQRFEEWRCIFWVLIGVNSFGSVFYYIFGSGKLQSWNFIQKDIGGTENHKPDYKQTNNKSETKDIDEKF